MMDGIVKTSHECDGRRRTFASHAKLGIHFLVRSLFGCELENKEQNLVRLCLSYTCTEGVDAKLFVRILCPSCHVGQSQGP